MAVSRSPAAERAADWSFHECRSVILFGTESEKTCAVTLRDQEIGLRVGFIKQGGKSNKHV